MIQMATRVHPRLVQGLRAVPRLLTPLLLAALAAGSLAACGTASRSAERLNHDGNQQYATGNYGGALETYRRAEVLRPDLPAINYNAGNALDQQNDFQRALAEDQQAIHSTDAGIQDRAYYSMGNTYVHLNQLQDAIDAYKSALRANPSDTDAKYNLEIIQRRLDQEQARQQQVQPQTQQGQQNQQANDGQSGQPGEAQQGQPGGSAQAGQPGAGPSDATQAAAAQGGATGSSNGATSGYTGTPAGQAAALDPNLKQALGQFDQNGSVDSALQALDIIAQQERLQQSGNSQPPNPQGRDW
jgi:tetratricopeptide (TPR) repeat protein